MCGEKGEVGAKNTMVECVLMAGVGVVRVVVWVRRRGGLYECCVLVTLLCVMKTVVCGYDVSGW